MDNAAGLTVPANRCEHCPTVGICDVCGWRREWIGTAPSNARCPHPDCLTAGAQACKQFRASIDRMPPETPACPTCGLLTSLTPGSSPPCWWCSKCDCPVRASAPGAAVANVFDVTELSGRVYVFKLPRELDGVRRNVDGVATGRGRGISHTEALVFAAWLVRHVPAGRSRLDDILAAIEGMR